MKKLMSVFVMGAVMAVSSSTFAAPPNKEVTWSKCANWGAACLLNGPNVVRYGYPDNWAAMDTKGNQSCHPEEFEGADGVVVTGDPFGSDVEDKEKVCEVQD